jgi:hypothetical protein
MRSFDPALVGGLEANAWVAYYQRRWPAFLRSVLSLTRHSFGMPWPATMRGAWLVLRANRLWAPFPDNDPGRARACMQRFYELVAKRDGESFDPVQAARLELEWWRIHRELQHQRADVEEAPLVDALATLYRCVYGVADDRPGIHTAAAERALAMRHSDRWVAEGCDDASPLVEEERRALVRSYSALLDAVGFR